MMTAEMDFRIDIESTNMAPRWVDQKLGDSQIQIDPKLSDFFEKNYFGII